MFITNKLRRSDPNSKEKGLLPPERARMLRGWKHSGFNLHRRRRVAPDEGEDRERIAQYIIRSPFSTGKMRGQREKRITQKGEGEGSAAGGVIELSEHQPRRIPSKKWRELIRCWHPDREADRGRSGRRILSSARTADGRCGLSL